MRVLAALLRLAILLLCAAWLVIWLGRSADHGRTAVRVAQMAAAEAREANRTSPALPAAHIAAYRYYRHQESFAALTSLSLPMIFLILFITGHMVREELRKDKRFRTGRRRRRQAAVVRRGVVIAPGASAH